MEHTARCPLGLVILTIAVVSYALTFSGQWILQLVARIFTRRPSNAALSKEFGEWAIITGGSDGIGEALAVQLGLRGMKIWLISRNSDRLKEAKERVFSQVKHINPDVEIDTSVFDFSVKGWSDEAWSTLKKDLNQRDVGVLVNNVGLAYPSAQLFDELPEEFIDDLISVNLRSTLQMTRSVLPGMRQRHRGIILCVGSGASVLPTEPLYAAYAAVKAGITSFCDSLKVECASSRIIIQCHTPLLITTKLSKIKRSSITVLTPERYARDAIQSLESSTTTLWTTATSSPSLIHALILLVATKVVPLGLWNRYRLAATSDIRKRYLSKKKL